MGSDGGSGRRPLTSTERALLDSLLDHEFDGVSELREQALRVTASTGCECGCVTIDLHVPEDAPVSAAAGPVPLEGTVVDAAGEVIGGVQVFLADGRLAGLEVHSLDEPVPVVPSPELVSWESWADPPADDRPSFWQRLRSRSA
ncbi:hypothetical protein [Blastococcus haudaquaticus]|nr:hypothetical protein [Blastococcus haudaquaticus]